MKEAVATLRDAGSAEMIKEALTDRGIEVEVRRSNNTPLYFGAPSGEEFEIRVPPDRLEEARGLIDALTEQLERDVIAAAGVPAEDDDDESDALPEPEERPRKPMWALAIGLVGPIPGCGLLYARAFRLGYLFMGLSAALVIGGLASGNGEAALAGVLLKPLDVILAPFFAARFNRKLEEHAPRS
jgi:Putative prokaryotic signal transducing protein